jgi:hypothetical protein
MVDIVDAGETDNGEAARSETECMGSVDAEGGTAQAAWSAAKSIESSPKNLDSLDEFRRRWNDGEALVVASDVVDACGAGQVAADMEGGGVVLPRGATKKDLGLDGDRSSAKGEKDTEAGGADMRRVKRVANEDPVAVLAAGEVRPDSRRTVVGVLVE